jgi:hypothetical protein
MGFALHGVMALPFPIIVAAVKTKLRSLLDGTSRS